MPAMLDQFIFLQIARPNLSHSCMQKGYIFKHRDLYIDKYTFWEAMYLYSEMGDFLWSNLASQIDKLNETCIF